MLRLMISLAICTFQEQDMLGPTLALFLVWICCQIVANNSDAWHGWVMLFIGRIYMPMPVGGVE